MHPLFYSILRAFVNGTQDSGIKSNIRCLMDFCTWSAKNQIFRAVPVWVYLHESLFVQGVPILDKAFVVEENLVYLRDWIKHVKIGKLVSWALALRAMEMTA
jgi:hypothetical protein